MNEKTLKKLKSFFGDQILSIYRYDKHGTYINVFVIKKADFLVFDKTRRLFQEERFILLLEDDVINGIDVFPLDFLHIKNHLEVIEGKDYFSKMKINKKDLRHKLEYELRNKLVYLREQYISAPERRKFLKVILPTFGVLLEGALFLKGIKISEDFIGNIESAEETFVVNFTVFKKLHEHAQSNTAFDKSEVTGIIQNINDSLRELMEAVNHLKI